MVANFSSTNLKTASSTFIKQLIIFNYYCGGKSTAIPHNLWLISIFRCHYLFVYFSIKYRICWVILLRSWYCCFDLSINQIIIMINIGWKQMNVWLVYYKNQMISVNSGHHHYSLINWEGITMISLASYDMGMAIWLFSYEG